MFKKVFFSLTLLMLSHFAFSQKLDVRGSIKDTTSSANVKNAVVALLSPGDSVMRGYTRVKEDGSYVIKNIKPGKYIMMVMHPAFADFVDDIEVKDANQQLAQVAVTPKSRLLEAVILKSGSPMRIKGDTTIYTADSFKVSANANVEELLKKMPGFQVDKNGQIKQMGEVVEKVLVDGEEFFGDDPGMAVKNLRADAVKEVQVFNKKSDQAEFTGIDDGNTKKTINLKLKEDKKKGFFGKIDMAGGLVRDADPRYNNNLLFSSFKGKRKISAFVLNGNTGQDGLSWQDEQKYGSSDFSVSMDEEGSMNYSWNGGNDDEPYVNTENGFIKNINAGLQYSNKFSDRQNLNLSPKFNSQIYNNNKQIFSQTQLTGDSSFLDNSNTNTYINRSNFKLSAIYDLKLDSSGNNSLRFTANGNFYHTESDENSYSSRRYQSGDSLNSRNGNTKTDYDKQVFYGSGLFKHKFKKARRTISLNLDLSLNENNGTNYLQTRNIIYGAMPFTQDINQMSDNEKSTNRYSARVVYTEPLSPKYSLELAHELSLNRGKNDQTTYDYSPISKEYDEQVDSLTNNFDQKIVVNKPSFRINFNDKKLKYNFGSGFGFTHFDLLDKTYNKEYLRNYVNFFPAAMLQYTYKGNRNLRINYNGYTAQPTINQLQPLRNNTDQFNQYIGNPDLKPSFTNSFSISNNSYDFLTDRWKNIYISVRTVSNAITSSITNVKSTGVIKRRPINTNGNMSMNLWSGYGFKWKKIDTRFNFNPGVSYSKNVDEIDGLLNTSKILNANFSTYISKTKDKKYDISISNDFSHSYSSNTLNTNKTNYNTNTFSVDGTIYYKKVWSLNSDFQFYSRQKISDYDTKLNNQLWNAKLQRTFKSNEFTAYVKVRDILNQNIGINRSFYRNTFTEERNDRLKRYFLVGFAWDFKNKGSKTN
ncbi:MAG: hypothetical protein JWQ27_416 [Ferruginibacter sp.]|nr:hypothetical protein [Ferruginibacter sp.]